MKLNILCCNPDGGAFLYITKGWEDAFKALGHSFRRWNGSDKELIDFKPHLYLGCSGWRQNFPLWARKKFNTKIAIHVNPWGNTVLKPLPGEPNVNEQTPTIKWVINQKPDFLYCYALKDDIQHMWNKWESNVAPVAPMPCAANAVMHKPVTPTSEFKCDIGFIGGFWPYKAINLNKYLVPVINDKNAKVYGWGGWNHRKYCGKIPDHKVNQLFSSAKICPSIVEPHTSRYGIDIPERMFKVPLAGGFTICDPCYGLNRYVSLDTFPMANDPSEYYELIDYFLKDDNYRETLKLKQRQEIIKHHTYFNRVKVFLEYAGFLKEAEETQRKIDELSKSLQ